MEKEDKEENRMKNIALIGSGGINSYAAENVNNLIKDFELMDVFVKVFDDDVVEEKNLINRNQNFTEEDLMLQKAEVIGKRYTLDFENIRITEENISKLEKFDIIMLGVDNNKSRKMLYEYAINNKKIVIDLRAQGTNIMYVVVDGSKDMEYYNNEYFKNAETMEKHGSCQLQHSINNKHIENGNRVIASLGVWGLLLKHIRGEQIARKEYKMVY